MKKTRFCSSTRAPFRRLMRLWPLLCVLWTLPAAAEVNVSVTRLGHGPIIHPGLHPSIGENIQGPSNTSRNGIDFTTQPQNLGRTYLRVFRHQGKYYGIAMPGQVYRSADPFGPFEQGPLLFNANMRHMALLPHGDQLLVFWTQVGDAPEHIKLSTINLTGDWQQWQDQAVGEVLRPELP